MAKYRIKEVSSEQSTTFIVQKKLLFFWFNPLNIDAYITGHFDTLKEAEDMVQILTTKNFIKYHLYKYAEIEKKNMTDKK